MTDGSLRVCILSKQFPPGVGGAETYAYELANGLGKLGHDVDVYTQWIEDPDEEVDTHENVSVYRIAKARRKLVTFETLWYSLQARREVDFDEYDLVHGTLMPASTIAVTPFNDIDAPVVVTSHGTSLGEAKAVALETPADYLLKFLFHPMNVVMDWVAGTDADGVIAISDHAHEELTTVYGFDEDDVEMIPHGVDTNQFYPRDDHHQAVDPEKVTILYVGRLGARKGLDLALQALSILDSSRVEFLIAGTGRHERRLKQLAEDLGISGQTQFLGYVPEDQLPSLYSSADVFVLPSVYEGFGLVLLEAMACETPVIGSDVGGIPTAIEDGETGLVVPRDVGEFSEALSMLTVNEQLREEMRQASAATAQSMSWPLVIEDVHNLYQARLSSCNN